MKLTAFPHKLLEKMTVINKSCRYYWNTMVRHITIDSQPVFIVGCGHSGTSLLLAVLGTHSKLYAIMKVPLR
jgi:hypothetical protein